MPKILPIFPFLILILLLPPSCAKKQISPKREEAAQRVRPGWRQVGYASWYGAEFHGRRTASGELFNMYDLTAAHRTLPIGTTVMVTRLDNHRSVKVRINDRGPFARGRIIDLSYASAKMIGLDKDGVVKVRLEVVSSPGRTSTYRTSHSTCYTIQVGSFAKSENARRLKNILAKDFRSVHISRTKSANSIYYQVRVGTYRTKLEARLQALKLMARGYDVFIVPCEKR